MEDRVDQSVSGNNNIQVGRDLIVKLFSRSDRARESGVPYTLYILTVLSIFGTMLPHPVLNLFFSISAGLSFLTWACMTRHWFRPLLIGAITMSIFTGCAGPLLVDPGEPIQVCSTEDLCRSTTMKGLGVLGFGLDQVTREEAVRQAGFSKVIASQEIRGYGLVSMAYVRVWGE